MCIWFVQWKPWETVTLLSVQVCQKGIVGRVLTRKCIRSLWEFTHTRRDKKDEVIPSGTSRAGRSHVMLCLALFGSVLICLNYMKSLLEIYLPPGGYDYGLSLQRGRSPGAVLVTTALNTPEFTAVTECTQSPTPTLIPLMLISKPPEGLRYTRLFLLSSQLIFRVLSGWWGETSWAVVLEPEQRMGWIRVSDGL